MKKVEAIVFDVGGVLIDLDFAGMFDRFAARSKASKEEIKRLFLPERSADGECDSTILARATAGRLSLSETMDQIYAGSQFLGTKEEMTEIYHSLLPHRLEGTLEVLNLLAGDYRIGILSNTNAWSWDRCIAILPELSIAEHVMTSFEVGLVKPDQRLFQHVCNRFNLSAQEIVFIDDTADIIEKANACGLRGIHFTGHASLVKELELLGVHLPHAA